MSTTFYPIIIPSSHSSAPLTDSDVKFVVSIWIVLNAIWVFSFAWTIAKAVIISMINRTITKEYMKLDVFTRWNMNYASTIIAVTFDIIMLFLWGAIGIAYTAEQVSRLL